MALTEEEKARIIEEETLREKTRVNIELKQNGYIFLAVAVSSILFTMFLIWESH